MKKLMFVLLIIFAITCEKDSGCWNCMTTMITQCSGYASETTIVTTTECDMNNNEIEIYEKLLTRTTTATTGGITCTIKSTCNCRKQ